MNITKTSKEESQLRYSHYDENDVLVCVTVYKKGDLEVIRRLNEFCGRKLNEVKP